MSLSIRVESCRSAAARARAFTLIELLVVVGIIALLVGIVVAVIPRVLQGAGDGSAKNTIRALDTVLGSAVTDRGSIPGPVAPFPQDRREQLTGARAAGSVRVVPVADVAIFTDGNTARLLNSVGLFLAQTSEITAAAQAAQSFDEAVVEQRPAYSPTASPLPANNIALRTIVDPWGNPYRYVHPALDGVVTAAPRAKNQPGNAITDLPALFPSESREFLYPSLRRNKITKEEFASVALPNRDSDGGECVGGQPYFYSAGKDGDPSTTDDNVYATTPRFVDVTF